MDKVNKLNWNLVPLYKSIHDTKLKLDLENFKKESRKLSDKWKKDNTYLTNPNRLKVLLDDINNFEETYSYGGKPAYYIYLNHFLDNQNHEILALYNLVNNYLIESSNDLHFITLNLSRLDLKIQTMFLKSPILIDYHKYLKDIFKFSSHILSQNEQNILNEFSDLSSEAWNRMLSGILSTESARIVNFKGKIKKLNFEKLTDTFKSTDKIERDNAAKAFNEILEKHIKVAEAEFNATLGYKEKVDRIKKYNSPIEERLLSDEIDEVIVNNLKEVMKKNIDLPRRFYKVKAKLLGLNKLAYHERALEYTKYSNKYNLNESINEISRVFESLNPEFNKIFKEFVYSNKIDSESKKGKSGGAFCFHANKTSPTFILTNYHNKLEDLLTLAHEAGHGINNEMIKSKQMGIYLSTPPSTAEIASTFFEDSVVSDLIEKAPIKEKLSILVKKLDMDISSTFRQIEFLNFELEVHELFRNKHYLSHNEIGKIFQKHMKEYMGEYVKQDKGSENWWIYVPHFRYFFYVYSYALGILISKYLQSEVKKDKKYIDKVKFFLSVGTSKEVKDIMSEIGINIHSKSIWEDGIKEIRNNLELLEKLTNGLH